MARKRHEVWAVIVRVSFVGARGGDSFHADEDQVADVERYAARYGAKLVLMEPELSVSGGKPIEERPGLKAAIEGVERGEYTGIVAANLKRLTRSRSGIEIWNRVEAAGGHVHCAAEGIDTSTSNGRFIRDIHLAEAVREREEHGERHARRRKATAEAGLWRVRQTPRGYTFSGPADADGKFRGKARALTPDDGAESVRKAFRDRAAGKSYSAIARDLHMTPGGVRAMLKNRVYLGEIWDTVHVCRNAHKPLIEEDLFNAVQQGGVRPGRIQSDERRTPALLAGLVRCAACGHVMSRGKTGGRYAYICPANHSGERCPARAAISCHLLDPFVVDLALTELQQVQSRAGQGDALQDARTATANAERELSAYLSAVSAAAVGAEPFAAGAAERRDRLDAALEVERRLLATQPAAIPFGATAAQHWKDLDVHERNALLRALLDVIVVRRAGGRGAATVPLEHRVRVVRSGSGIQLPNRTRGRAMGLHPISFDDIAPPSVLGILRSEDDLQRRRRSRKM